MTKSEFQQVAVLYGGTSAERAVSLKSGEAVHKALVAAGVSANLVDTAKISPLMLRELGYDCAFVVLHGRGGEDGVIQGVLDYLDIPYTGSRVLGSALCMDKIRTKQVWQALQLPTANYMVAHLSEIALFDFNAAMEELNGKAMVKPSHEGSSIGMSIVNNAAELEVAVNEALKYDDDVLIEQWISGPEYTVSMLDGKALPAINMRTPNTFYDYQAKYESNQTEYVCPAGLSVEDESYIRSLASQAFDAAGASVWGRVDLMRDSDGQFYLLEANTVPGMTEKSLVPMAAKAAGLDFEQLVLRILQLAS